MKLPLEAALPYRLLALLVLAVFYGIYLVKQWVQKRRGIQTMQIGRRKEAQSHTVETFMGIATVGIIPAQLMSIGFGWSHLPAGARFTGFCVGMIGNLIFLISVLCMKDSWRAGIPDKDKTELVTDGIYAYSRNPAFLGFDLQYIGVLLMYCNLLTGMFTVFAIGMLHLQILQEEHYLTAAFGKEYQGEAERALSFIEERLIIEGRVMVRYRDGEVKQQGFIDEYAYLLWAYIEMYEASLNLAFLKKAKNTAERMIDLFWDEEAGGFFFYGEDSEQLLIRPKEAYDGALPSGNGVAALQLLRLARLSGDSQLEQKVGELMEAFSASIKSYPTAHTYLLQAHLTMNMKMKEVVVLTKEESAFVKSLQHSFYPEVTYLVSGESESLASIAPFTAGYKKMDNRSTYYVCENFACRQPTTDVGQAEQYMNE